jgi:hypothetical protein
MGFNKKYLPPLEVVQQLLKENANYLDSFEKADAWIGSPETANFLQEEIRKKYESEGPQSAPQSTV